MPGARALILPHHWLVGDLIVDGLRDLAATADYQRVVLVGPDHPNAGASPAATSERAWDTPFGVVETDRAAVHRLLGMGVVRRDHLLIEHEHSVAGLVPAVAYFLPHARILPLAVRNDIRAAEATVLAEAVATLADDRTMIILSIDFSHYLTPREARRKDSETLRVLRGLDSARVRRFGADHLDARGAGMVALEAMRRVHAREFVLRANTDGGALPGYDGGVVTSYIVGYYR